MEKMIGPRRPFYKAGPVMRLEKIPADVFAAFIEARFAKSGIQPEPGLGAAIVDLAGNLPVRRAAARARDVGRRAAAPARGAPASTTCTRRSARLLARAGHDVRGGLAAADARAARRAARGRCCRADASCSRPTRARGTGSAAPSSIQASLAALVKQDLLLKEGPRYVVVDSLLREWVARRTF